MQRLAQAARDCEGVCRQRAVALAQTCDGRPTSTRSGPAPNGATYFVRARVHCADFGHLAGFGLDAVARHPAFW